MKKVLILGFFILLTVGSFVIPTSNADEVVATEQINGTAPNVSMEDMVNMYNPLQVWRFYCERCGYDYICCSGCSNHLNWCPICGGCATGFCSSPVYTWYPMTLNEADWIWYCMCQ